MGLSVEMELRDLMELDLLQRRSQDTHKTEQSLGSAHMYLSPQLLLFCQEETSSVQNAGARRGFGEIQFSLFILWMGKLKPEEEIGSDQNHTAQPWSVRAPSSELPTSHLQQSGAGLGLYRRGEPHLLPGTLLQGAWGAQGMTEGAAASGRPGFKSRLTQLSWPVKKSCA